MNRYETDWYAWLHEQAECLDQGRWEALDVPHLVEELELMAESAPGELFNRLAILLAHLLKLTVAAALVPGVYDRAQRGWRLTCREQRRRLVRLLDRNPRLRPTVPDEMAEAYQIARLQALVALQVHEDQIPLVCPWNTNEVLAEDCWPKN